METHEVITWRVVLYSRETVARPYIVHLVVGVENSVTKNMSATKREGVTRDWKKLGVRKAS
jgi:hypothetical protein